MTLAVVTVLALLGWAFPYTLDYLSTETTTRRAKEAEEKIDREGPAFTSRVREEEVGLDGGVVITMDRPLTPAESETLTTADLGKEEDVRRFNKLVASHGGEKLNVPAGRTDPYTRVWLMDLFSDRAASLSIVGMRAKDLRCEPASAKTVLHFPPQGAGTYEGMWFDLSKNPYPTIADRSDKHFGKPFFSYKKIDLGNGATPGGLRVGVTSGAKDCDWVFEVEYRDAEGTHTQQIKNGEKRFTIDGYPEHPEQTFVSFGPPDYFKDCSTDAAC
ncbi:hypothetical protein H8N01_18595 [Streptomyces sp. AC536]|uniref:hypothetical protein n=1 Tax=Streptomyces buecherae TaxID=2763006 RepID=UPI00164D105D|nr:hypothetical protein [Streptomyces buecherae]MBC3984525.1 hypothetical protein [Streptomyces buecherae]